MRRFSPQNDLPNDPRNPPKIRPGGTVGLQNRSRGHCGAAWGPKLPKRRSRPPPGGQQRSSRAFWGTIVLTCATSLDSFLTSVTNSFRLCEIMFEGIASEKKRKWKKKGEKKERTSERMSRRPKEETQKRTNTRTLTRRIKRTNAHANKRTNGRRNEQTHEEQNAGCDGHIQNPHEPPLSSLSDPMSEDF